jgi:hypothetical protein
MLTDSDLQSLERAGKEQLSYGKKVFGHLRPKKAS